MNQDDVEQIFSSLSIDGDIDQQCALTPRAIAQETSASFHFVVSGAFFLNTQELKVPARIQEGDFLLMPRGDKFTLTDNPGHDAPTLDHLRDPTRSGHCRIVGHRGEEIGRLLCGCFHFQRDDPFAAMLPRRIHIRADDSANTDGLRSTIALLREEIASPRIGSQAVLHRLTELLFIQVFRAHATQPGASVNLLAALRNDKRVGQTLMAMHARPEYPWTIETLARQAACSRSAFLTRFASLVGCPPLRYLTSLRMARARKLLLTSASSLETVSEAVGYGSVEALTRAFRRSYDMTPAELRARHGRAGRNFNRGDPRC